MESHRSITLVLGGVRSGKSRWAQQTARAFARVTFIATAQPTDAEMRRKITAHRRERPATWKTVEATVDLDRAIGVESHGADLLLVDCLTVHCATLLMRSRTAAARHARLAALVAAIHSSPASIIVVSNEVGCGVVPMSTSGRMFRDLLGEANQAIAGIADRVVLLVAGLPLVLKGRLL